MDLVSVFARDYVHRKVDTYTRSLLFLKSSGVQCCLQLYRNNLVLTKKHSILGWSWDIGYVQVKSWTSSYYNTSQDHPGMLTTLYQLLLQSTPSSFSVHPRIILGYSPPSTYCYSGVLKVHSQYTPGSSWDAHTLYLQVQYWPAH